MSDTYTWLGRRRSGDAWARGGRYNHQRDAYRCGGASLQACVLVLLFAAAVLDERARAADFVEHYERSHRWYGPGALEAAAGGLRYGEHERD